MRWWCTASPPSIGSSLCSKSFRKKYPFLTPEHYRANATGVFNRFATEARAGQTLADVIDISAGETHTLGQMGLTDSYLSPMRTGIPMDFMAKVLCSSLLICTTKTIF